MTAPHARATARRRAIDAHVEAAETSECLNYAENLQ
jgi:hypothetical protein